MPARPPDPDPDAADLELPVQTRADVRLMPDTVDAERRTVELVWSTGAAVRRRDPCTGKRYDEVLSLEEAMSISAASTAARRFSTPMAPGTSAT